MDTTDQFIAESGSASLRNEEFSRQWSRARIISSRVRRTSPTVFDIGAHRGESLAFFRTVWSDSLIVCIEPDPVNFTELMMRVQADPRSRAVRAAVSSESGRATFFRNSLSHTSSLEPLNDSSQDSIALFEARRDGSSPRNQSIEKIEVEVKTIDSLMEEFGVPSVIKVDVQGHEIESLRGAQQSIKCVDALIVEVSLFDYYATKSSVGAVEALVSAGGLSLYSVLELSNNPMNGRTDWLTLLYTRN